MTYKSFLLTLPLLMGPVACQSDKPSGKALYSSSCVSCHNSNTRHPGAIGPALFNVKYETLRDKLDAYRYQPKIVPDKTIMPMFRHLTLNQIHDLHDYISDPREHK